MADDAITSLEERIAKEADKSERKKLMRRLRRLRGTSKPRDPFADESPEMAMKRLRVELREQGLKHSTNTKGGYMIPLRCTAEQGLEKFRQRWEAEATHYCFWTVEGGPFMLLLGPIRS